ncbi:hypothetical protein HNR60_002279 [Rhodopseudomonas rhenobacensis]|uniref:Hemolysin XhlA n=1 Tax=Rhodopseudomonas rhenobacensis TaxID=87461 RepID=A0A7W8DZ69_9BRAD|nr:hypothetical protein [Rhodopseudomonas rhenobacensis]MBB5047522.1 hypothetical protein [Rhodopseudomonas rhenobacensis]
MAEQGAGYSPSLINAADRFGGSKPPGPPLQPPDGGGTFDGMGPRIAKLEAAVEHIQRDIGDIKTDLRTLRDNARGDFRLLFGAIISVAVGMAGLMAKGFHWF